MNIAIVGNFLESSTGNWTEERIMVDDLRSMGHSSFGITKGELPEDVPFKCDVAVVANSNKISAEYIGALRERLGCPVVYLNFDYLAFDKMSQGHANLYLEAFAASDLVLVKQTAKLEPLDALGIRWKYFTFDVAPDFYRPLSDPLAAKWRFPQRPYPDVVPIGMTGTWIHEPSFRNAFLKELDEKLPIGDFHLTGITIDEFRDRVGIRDERLHHPMVEDDFCRLVDITQVNLSIENYRTPGFWSNRISCILRAGGFVIATKNDGMEERFGKDGENLVYCDTPDDCIELSYKYIRDEKLRKEIAARGHEFAEKNLTLRKRVEEMVDFIGKELSIIR